LRELNLGCSLSDLEVFPDLSGLINLKTLIASGEAVQGQKLPPYFLFAQVLESVKTLKNLEVLDISWRRTRKKAERVMDDKGKITMPDVFAALTNLQALDICDMNLEAAPKSIFELKNLKNLNIKGNKFSRDAIREIVASLPKCHISSDICEFKPRKR
jgi:Leucine-rich repeat (LRR) protein